MSGWRFDDSPGTAEALNRLCREEAKLRLLEDIRQDMAVCQLEGWNWRDYLLELRNIIDSFLEVSDHD